jgi:DNA repair exonuclease SbcCD nuclease subunit
MGKTHSLKRLKLNGTKVYWCPGNHEDWDELERMYGRHRTAPVEIREDLFYCPIGSRLKLKGKTILFVGGADSIDRNARIFGISWFPQELLKVQDVDYILANEERVDIVVSHTCPMSFDMLRTKRFDKWNDPTRHALNIILHKYKPDLWLFGHWHHYLEGRYGKTYWIGLCDCPFTMWWKELKI